MKKLAILTIITATLISCSTKEVQTINDLSFKIEEGEFVFIVGASGWS